MIVSVKLSVRQTARHMLAVPEIFVAKTVRKDRTDGGVYRSICSLSSRAVGSSQLPTAMTVWAVYVNGKVKESTKRLSAFGKTIPFVQ